MKPQQTFFYQQLLNRSFALTFITLGIVALSFTWYLFKQQAYLDESQQPMVSSEQLKKQKLLHSIQTSLTYLQNIYGSEPVLDKHSLLEHHLYQLKALQKNANKRNFPYLNTNNESLAILRIHKANAVNQQLTKQVNQIIAESLTLLAETIERKGKQASIVAKQLINKSEFNALTVASRTQSYLRISNQINEYHYAREQLTLMSVFTQQLNLQANLSVVEQLTLHANTFFTWFESQQAILENDNAKLVSNIQQLENLLLLEQALIGQWRGHLTLYQDYRAVLIAQQAYIQSLIQQTTLVVGKALSEQEKIAILLPNEMLRLIKQYEVPVQLKHIEIAIISLLALFILSFFMCLIGTYKACKRRYQEQLTCIEQFTTHHFTQANSPETHVILNLLADGQENHHVLLQEEVTNKPQTHNTLQQLLAQQHIGYWQATAEFDTTTLFQWLNKVAGTSSKTSLRRYFTVESVRQVIALARHLKSPSPQYIAKINLSMMSGETLILSIAYEHYFSGVFCVSEAGEEHEFKALNKQLAISHQELQLVQNSQLTERLTLLDTINQKAVKAMLQSQAECLTRKQPSSALYKQFVRLFEWSKDESLLAKITTPDYVVPIKENVLPQQILTALMNVALQHKSQKNIVQFLDNLPKRYRVDIAGELFQLMLTYIANIMLNRHRNAQLQLTCELVDKNGAQHFVKYQWYLHNEQGNKTIPEALSLLAAMEPVVSEENSETQAILFALADKLHAQDFNVITKEKGYEFSFIMPHVLSDQSVMSTPASQPLVGLAKPRILFISAITTQQTVFAALLKSIEAEIIVVPSVANAQPYLTEEQLTKKPIALLIKCHELTTHEQQTLEHNLTSIVKAKKPKILQLLPVGAKPCQHAQEDACQFAYPIDKSVFLNNLVKVMNNKPLITFTTTNEQQYIKANIELLFAVNDWFSHHHLITQLHALGFRLTFAATAEDMQRLWRTGRYLVLVTDVEQSPIVAVENGKQVKRAILSLSPAYCEQWQAQNNDSKWQVTNISQLASATQLTDILAHWIVVKEQPKAALMQPPQVEQPVEEQIKQRQSLSFDDVEPAFNLSRYAEHQASAELAAFMLDDYIVENIRLVEKLHYAISVKSTEQIDENLALLMRNAKILAADELVYLCRDMKKCLMAQEYQKAAQLMTPIKENVVLINQYADAI